MQGDQGGAAQGSGSNTKYQAASIILDKFAVPEETRLVFYKRPKSQGALMGGLPGGKKSVRCEKTDPKFNEGGAITED